MDKEELGVSAAPTAPLVNGANGLSPPSGQVSTDAERHLVSEVISMYHTTRLSDVPFADHILGKPSVRKALADYRADLWDALHRLHAWGECFIKDTPITAETLWREFPAAMKHAGEVLAKAEGR